MSKYFAFLYAVIGIIEVYAEVSGTKLLHFISKPLLMVVLIAFYYSSIAKPVSAFHKMLLFAFAFSWVGDVALMFVPSNELDTHYFGIPKHENFFLLGLVGFLITHVLYAIAFSKVSNRKIKSILSSKWWILIPLVIYMVFLLQWVFPAILANEKTKPFLAPVAVYTTVISIMVVFAINRFQRVNVSSFNFVMIGVLLFMFSDSIIAIDKFVYEGKLFMASTMIMALYITAQYLIAKGCLLQADEQA